MRKKVVIVGCGNVGMSYAYALVNQKTSVDELILVDIDEDRVEGEVMDLNHCLAFAPTKVNIRRGNYKDCKEAKIVVITAGVKQDKNETRMDLINKNSKILKGIVKKVVASGFKGIFVVVSNPVDIMTYITWKVSGFDYRRVIGTGTSLDTARLRYLIGQKIGIGPKNIHGYVIGEHGDSEFVPWSSVNVGLQNIKNFLRPEDLEIICEEVKQAAYKIIERKNATYYGIGMCLVRITNAILDDENAIITVSSYDKDNDIFMGLPAIINSSGVKGKIYVELTADEIKKLQNSVDIIKDAIKMLK